LGFLAKAYCGSQVHGMPPHIAAHVLGVSVPAATEVQRRIRGASRLNMKEDYLGVSPLTRTVACSQPGFVGQCPAREVETPSDAFPAVTEPKVCLHIYMYSYVSTWIKNVDIDIDIQLPAWICGAVPRAQSGDTE